MIEAGEEVAEIRVEHPVHLLAFDPDHQRVQRIVRPAPGPESVREAEEVRLVDGVQYLDDGALDDLVLQRGNPERPQPPVRLRDVHPPRRLRPVGAPVDTGMQIAKVRFEILPVVLPRHLVHPRRRPRAQPPIGRAQALDADVVQKRREPRIRVLACDSGAHYPAHLTRDLPGSASGARFAGPCSRRPAAFPPPTPPPVARPCSPASQVLRGCLTPDGRSSRASGSSPSPRGPPTRRHATPRPNRAGHHRRRQATVGPPGSRAWRFRACTGSQTARGPPTTRESAADDVAFHPVVRRRHPGTLISRLNSPAYAYPCQRFTDALTNASA